MNSQNILTWLTGIGGVLAFIGTVLTLLYKHYIGRKKNEIRELSARLEESQKAVADQAKEHTKIVSERDEFKARASKLDLLEHAHEDLAAAHTHAQETLRTYEREETTRGNRVRKALELEGAIWTQEVMAGTFPFSKLEERRTPIISVLNLKGGVGKTTLTAYLAWALANRGYRVLLLDLDLQGSLSSFFVTNADLKRMADDRLLLRNYLEAVTRDRKAKLLDFTHPLPCLNPKSRLVATTDGLSYSELVLCHTSNDG